MDSGCCMTSPSATESLSTIPRGGPGAELSDCVVVEKFVHLNHPPPRKRVLGRAPKRKVRI